jgi:hypothetical protein
VDIAGIVGADETTVRLVNDGDFDVEVDLYYGDEQDVAEALLTEFGTHVQRTVDAGSVYTFSRDCDDLQAVIIDDADLAVIGTVEDDTDVLRDGTDFGCGDTITFTFDHSDLLLDFRISIDVQ